MSVFGLINLVSQFNDAVGDDPYHNHELTSQLFTQILIHIREGRKQVLINQERILSAIQQGETVTKTAKSSHQKVTKTRETTAQRLQNGFNQPPPYEKATQE